MKKCTLFFLLFTSCSLLFSQAQKTPKDIEQTIQKMRTTIDSLSHQQEILKQKSASPLKEAKETIEQTKYIASTFSWIISCSIGLLTIAITVFIGMNIFDRKKLDELRTSILNTAHIDLDIEKKKHLEDIKLVTKETLDELKQNVKTETETSIVTFDQKIHSSVEEKTRVVDSYFNIVYNDTLKNFNDNAAKKMDELKKESIDEIKNVIQKWFNDNINGAKQ